MSDPKQTQRQSDELNLEAEMVKDLELREDLALLLLSGNSVGGPISGTSHKPV